MNALQQMQALLDEAQNCWQTYENSGQENGYWRGRAEQLEERAARYAAIVQAEQLAARTGAAVPLSFTARELLRCLLNQAFRDGYLDPDNTDPSTDELMRLIDAHPG